MIAEALSRKITGKQFKYLHVDEFQDINPAQYDLVRLWLGESGSLFAIGDPDQAIYSFRGAAADCFSDVYKRQEERRRIKEEIAEFKNDASLISNGRFFRLYLSLIHIWAAAPRTIKISISIISGWNSKKIEKGGDLLAAGRRVKEFSSEYRRVRLKKESVEQIPSS